MRSLFALFSELGTSSKTFRNCKETLAKLYKNLTAPYLVYIIEVPACSIFRPAEQDYHNSEELVLSHIINDKSVARL